jgi:hypothetical protein
MHVHVLVSDPAWMAAVKRGEKKVAVQFGGQGLNSKSIPSFTPSFIHILTRSMTHFYH